VASVSNFSGLARQLDVRGWAEMERRCRGKGEGRHRGGWCSGRRGGRATGSCRRSWGWRLGGRG
jgi:hypothetical protein